MYIVVHRKYNGDLKCIWNVLPWRWKVNGTAVPPSPPYPATPPPATTPERCPASRPTQLSNTNNQTICQNKNSKPKCNKLHFDQNRKPKKFFPLPQQSEKSAP